MPQSLKPEIRQAILEESKKEFLECGYKDASLRRIAKRSNIAVGNLYHYFKNKQNINETIVEPVLVEFNEMIKSTFGESVNINSKTFKFDLSEKELEKVVSDVSDKLVDIYEKNKVEFNILFLDSEVTEDLIKWFSALLLHIIEKRIMIPGFKKEKELFARSFAMSIVSGVKELFKVSDIKASNLKIMLRTYLKLYIEMFNVNIGKLVK